MNSSITYSFPGTFWRIPAGILLLVALALSSCQKDEAIPGAPDHPMALKTVEITPTLFWGQQTFTRGSGKPVAEAVEINGADLINFEGCLRLMVRILPERPNQLANALIRVNGSEVVVPGDFRRGTGLISNDLCGLQGDFTLEVELRGNPGSGLEIWIEGEMKNPVTDSRDGTEYPWLQYGDQKWMVKNLAWLPYVSRTDQLSRTEPYIYVYGYPGDIVSEAKATYNYQTFGALYNITSALTACPPGWHLPSHEEWLELSDFLVAQGFNYDGSYTGYKITKALASKSFWEPSDLPGTPGFEPENNNGSGFSFLPGGYMGAYGEFTAMGKNGYCWTSTYDSDWYYHIRRITFESTTFSYGSYGYTGAGWSVRCIRD